jgi:hypothetical protein
MFTLVRKVNNEIRSKSLWCFLALLAVAYSPVLIYPAVHHDRYSFFFENTRRCSLQQPTWELFRMGRPLAAYVDCFLTNTVESLPAYQILKVFSFALVAICFVLLSTVFVDRMGSWARHFLVFLIFSLPGFQYTVFMPFPNFWFSLALSLVAAQVVINASDLSWKSRSVSGAIALLFLAFLLYPAYTAIYLLALGLLWISGGGDKKNSSGLLWTGLIIYGAATGAYVFLLRVVYKTFGVQSSIYSTNLANPLDRVGMPWEALRFSLNNFWFTTNEFRPWMIYSYLSLVVGVSLWLLARSIRSNGLSSSLKMSLKLLGAAAFFYLAIMSPILTTQSGLILHRTTAIGLSFLIGLAFLMIEKAVHGKVAGTISVGAASMLAGAVVFLVFINLQQSSLNSLRELEIIREQVAKSLDHNIRWIHVKNDFDPNKSYIGVPPSYGDEFRMPSAWNLGNLSKMVQLAMLDRHLSVGTCPLASESVMRGCLGTTSQELIILTQVPAPAQALSASLGVPYFFLDLTAFLDGRR